MDLVIVSPLLPFLAPLGSLLAGIAILIWPRLLSTIVAVYLILFGILGLLLELR